MHFNGETLFEWHQIYVPNEHWWYTRDVQVSLSNSCFRQTLLALTLLNFLFLFKYRMWSQFVDCVRRYVTSCFNEERKQQFQKSVESSVETVHAICSSDLYQKGNRDFV